MSLLGSQGGRTSANEKTIKETLLNEQIGRLREIYQDTSAASEKVLSTLRKVIEFNQRTNLASDPPAAISYFMEDLSSIQDSFISLIENCEADKEQFVSCVIFRDSEKQLSTGFFKQMMKSHEDFKERLNVSILRLQKDIQTLESNGFHIYSTSIKPNNVLGTLKKHTLDKFIASLSEMHTVFAKMKAQMSAQLRVDKKAIKAEFKNEVQKMKEYCKLAQQICLKEKLATIMMSEEINSLNLSIVNQSKKVTTFEQAIKTTRKAIKAINNQIAVQSPKEPYSSSAFHQHMADLKQSVERHMLFTPKLYKAPAHRSKSCHTIITTESRRMGRSEESGASQLTIIGGDFLEQSVQN